jgi:hypothetical protein
MQSYFEPSEDFEKRDENYIKVTFLSYHISLYVSTIQRNSRYECVSVEEIYHFVQDLHSELGYKIPSITKKDVSYCFSLLESLGVCNCLK